MADAREPGPIERAMRERLAALSEAEQRELAATVQAALDALAWRQGHEPRWPRRTIVMAEPGPIDDASMVPIGHGDLWVRRDQWYTAVGGDLPYTVRLCLRWEGLRVHCTEVRFEQRHDEAEVVRMTKVREVRLDELIRAAQTDNTGTYVRQDNGHYVRAFPATNPTTLAQRDGARGRPRAASHDELERVALIYRDAVAAGDTEPTAAVERLMHYASRNIAKKRVQAARQRGHLEPAPGPRQGGLAPKSTTKKERKPR